MKKAACFFLSIAVFSAYVLGFDVASCGATGTDIDAHRLYVSKRDAIVVVWNERDESLENPQKENNTQKDAIGYGRGVGEELRLINHLPFIYRSDGPDGVSVLAAGGGAIIREDGIVVTSYHIVKNSKRLHAELFNGEILPAELIGFDPRSEYDIAVLKINAVRSFPVIQLGDPQDFYIGKPLLMIGHPYMYKYTVSKAAISNLIPPALPRLMVFHSSVLPGNSGSPLFDADGRLIGVVYASMRDGDTQGIATPLHMVKEVLDKILKEKSAPGSSRAK